MSAHSLELQHVLVTETNHEGPINSFCIGHWPFNVTYSISDSKQTIELYAPHEK